MAKTEKEIKRIATIFQKMWVKDCKVNKIEPYPIDTSGYYDESFIEVCLKLKMRGVKDYAFPLRINNTQLLNISHFGSPDSMSKAIRNEIEENFWFYFRRIYIIGGVMKRFAKITIADAIVGTFALNRVSTWLSHPRQTGGTLIHKALASYMVFISDKNRVSFIGRSNTDVNMVKRTLYDDLEDDCYIPSNIMDKIRFFDQFSDKLNGNARGVKDFHIDDFMFISEAEFFKNIEDTLSSIGELMTRAREHLGEFSACLDPTTICLDSTYASFHSNSGLNAWRAIKRFGVPFNWNMMNIPPLCDQPGPNVPTFIYIDTNEEDYDIDIIQMMILMDCPDTSIYDRELLMVREPFWDKVTYQELVNESILRRIAEIDSILTDHGYMAHHSEYTPNISGNLVVKSAVDRTTMTAFTSDDLNKLEEEKEELEKQLTKIIPQ